MKVQIELTKRYYTIGEVAKMFDVSNSLIRYWETEFSQLKPHKTRKGDRRYTVKDVRLLERIYTLVKERGFTLDGAKKELKKKPSADTDYLHQLANRLEKLSKKLHTIKDDLHRL